MGSRRGHRFVAAFAVAVVVLACLEVNAFTGGSASGAVPGTHVVGARAICEGANLHLVIDLSNVPAGVNATIAFSGAETGTRIVITDGSDQITVTFPGDCPRVCEKTVDVDVSLAGRGGTTNIAEDKPFVFVPIRCVPSETTTATRGATTTTVQTLGSTIVNSTTTTAQRRRTTSTTLQRSGVTAAKNTSSTARGAAAVLGASETAGPAGTSAVNGASLPRTGTTPLPLLLIGMAGVGAGTAFVFSGKRRGRQRS